MMDECFGMKPALKSPHFCGLLLLQFSVVAPVAGVSAVMTTMVSAKMSASKAQIRCSVHRHNVRLWGIVSLRSIVAVAPTVRANVSMA